MTTPPTQDRLRPDGFEAAGPDSPATDGMFWRVGIWLFLASLVMLFGASLVGYLFVRLGGEYKPAADFDVPVGFYYSTVALLAAGFVVELAARTRSSIGRRNALLGSCLLSATFIALQTPPLLNLLARHNAGAEAAVHGLYGLIFTLVVVHACHVIGGLIPLGVVTLNQCLPGRRNPSAGALRATAIYWHFLDGVWLTMLAMFILTR